jgi:hypothetical protein
MYNINTNCLWLLCSSFLRCFVFSTARAVFVFCLHWFCYFIVALVDKFSCALVGCCSIHLRGYVAHYWGICCFMNMCECIMRFLLTICYAACWFLLLAASVLHFCNPFLLRLFFTTLLRPCTLVSTLRASSLTCIAAFSGVSVSLSCRSW